MASYRTLVKAHENVVAAMAWMNETLEGVDPDRIVSITQSSTADSGPGFSSWFMTTMVVIRCDANATSSTTPESQSGNMVDLPSAVIDVVLVGYGPQKVPVIDLVRELTGLGLKESKALVDSAPQPVVRGVDKEVAEKVQRRFSDVGATTELKAY